MYLALAELADHVHVGRLLQDPRRRLAPRVDHRDGEIAAWLAVAEE